MVLLEKLDISNLVTKYIVIDIHAIYILLEDTQYEPVLGDYIQSNSTHGATITLNDLIMYINNMCGLWPNDDGNFLLRGSESITHILIIDIYNMLVSIAEKELVGEFTIFERNSRVVLGMS